MDAIPVTSSFGQEPSDVLGYLTTSPEGINPKADLMWKLYKQNPKAFSFEPGYIEKEDGTIELLEISIVPNYRKDGNETKEAN